MTEYETGKLIYFDIETEPQAMENILAIAGPFDPDSVNTPDNWKPETRQAKVDKARAEYSDKLFERAPLNAMHGKVLAIGVAVGGTYTAYYCDTLAAERTALTSFWDWFREYRNNGYTWVGWNIHGFDLPFIIRRSWWQGLHVPRELWDLSRGYRSYTGTIDLCRVWTGDPREFAKLDDVSRFFGLPGKRMDGANFWKQWRAGGAKREEAEAYLREDDVMSLKVIAERIL